MGSDCISSWSLLIFLLCTVCSYLSLSKLEFLRYYLYVILSIWAATWQNQQNDCAPSKDSDQPGHPPSLIRVLAVRMKKAWVLSYPLSAQRRLWAGLIKGFAVCMKKAWVLIYPLSAQRRLWWDWADAQADLSLRWAHTHFVGFVMSRLISTDWWEVCYDATSLHNNMANQQTDLHCCHRNHESSSECHSGYSGLLQCYCCRKSLNYTMFIKFVFGIFFQFLFGASFLLSIHPVKYKSCYY